MFTPPDDLFDGIFQRLIFLLSGSTLDFAAPGEAWIAGVTATNRRGNAGTRIEIWCASKSGRGTVSSEWLGKLKAEALKELEVEHVSSSLPLVKDELTQQCRSGTMSSTRISSRIFSKNQE
jgi:hypothetical protein